jgi:hypothetical protein
VDVLLLDVSVLENLLDGFESLPEEIHIDFLELGAGKGLGVVVTTFEGLDLETNTLLRRECPLGFLNLALELAQSAEIARNVSASLLLVKFDEVVDDSVVEVFTTKMSITSGRENLKDTVVDGKEGYIESSTAEIIDDDLRLATLLLVETIGDGGGGRFVNDTENVEASDDSGVLGSLALSVVEVSGDGDDGVGDFLSEVSFSSLLHLGQNHGGDL